MASAFLTNCWYVAAWPEDITRTPLRRVFLDQPVVLFRLQDGTAVALADSCPHRFVPLSRGQLVGDEIECCYHGLRFDAAGACTLNPHGDGTIPRTAKVRAYDLVERHGMVWIWMGDAAADPARIPEIAIPNFPALGERDKYGAVAGVLHIAANFQLITDNLLDLSHAQYLHPGLRVANAQRMRHEMRHEGNEIFSDFWRDNGEPNGLMRLLGWPVGVNGDSRANMHWYPPSLLVLDVGATGVGRPVHEGVIAPSLHMLTPETEKSTHYFFAFLRLVGLEDAALQEKVRALGMQAFAMEDKPVIEAQQAQLGDTEIMSLGPTLLSPDAAGVRARRVLQSLLAAEAKAAS